MKKRLSVFILALVLPALACISPVTITFDGVVDKEVVRGSGNSVSENRNVRDFDSIQMMIQGNVIITQSDRESLQVTADDNLMDYIKTEIEGRTLVLEYTKAADDLDIRPSTAYLFEVEMIDVVELEIFGMGDINSETIVSDRIDLSIYGLGDIHINKLSTDRLNVNIFGLGDVEVAGTASFVEIDIAGAGDVLAGDLQAEDAKVDIPGSGSATVWVSGDLDVNIPGAGTVRYYGDPLIDFNSPGAGALRDLGEK